MQRVDIFFTIEPEHTSTVVIEAADIKARILAVTGKAARRSIHRKFAKQWKQHRKIREQEIITAIKAKMIIKKIKMLLFLLLFLFFIKNSI